VAPGTATKGGVAKSPISHIDVFPTLAELCGVKPPANVQGQSLVSMLKDPSVTGRGWAITQVTRGGGPMRATITPDVGSEGRQFFGYSLRTPRWRYTEWDEGRAGRELYDHDQDQRELKNLASDPAHEKTVADLSAQLRTAAKATFPADGRTPPIQTGLWAPNLTEP
jgi:iduronate 2-sulfatase